MQLPPTIPRIAPVCLPMPHSALRPPAYLSLILPGGIGGRGARGCSGACTGQCARAADNATATWGGSQQVCRGEGQGSVGECLCNHAPPATHTPHAPHTHTCAHHHTHTTTTATTNAHIHTHAPHTHTCAHHHTHTTYTRAHTPHTHTRAH